MKLDSKQVREARERRALSIREVCARAGVSPHTWLRAEHGGELRPDSVRRIADYLGVEPGELLEEPSPLGEAPRESGPEEATGPEQWDPVRKLSPQAKRGIRGYMAALGRHIPPKSAQGKEITPGLARAIEELAEAMPEVHLLGRMEAYSVLHKFTREAPPDVVADVLRDEDTHWIAPEVVEGFVALVREAA